MTQCAFRGCVPTTSGVGAGTLAIGHDTNRANIASIGVRTRMTVSHVSTMQRRMAVQGRGGTDAA